MAGLKAKQLIVLLTTLMLLVDPLNGVLESIKIGLILVEGEDHLEAAFDEALGDLEARFYWSSFRLEPIKRLRVSRDSYATAMIACELLGEGVAAIFGPGYRDSRDVVSNIAGRFGVPHLEFSYRRRDEDFTKSVNFYPGSSYYEKVIAEVANRMRWHSFTFVYQTDDNLSRLQEVLQSRDRPHRPVTVKQLRPLSEIQALKSYRERDREYESLVKDLQSSAQYTLLLDVETNNLVKLLTTMKHMGFMNDYFMCLIVNLDAPEAEIRQLLGSDSVANLTRLQIFGRQGITGIQDFLPEDDFGSRWSLEEALLYDSVIAFGQALDDLHRDLNSFEIGRRLNPKPLSCDGSAKYDMGQNLIRQLLERNDDGVDASFMKTGPMSFDDRGRRRFELDIINNQAGKSNVIGSWKQNKLMMRADGLKDVNETFAEVARSKIFKVSTKLGAPYVMKVENGSMRGIRIGDQWYEGYCIDLIAKIEEVAKIKCEFEIVPDGQHGSYNPETGQWNGLIRRLLDLKADLAICDLTITSERQSAVDFSVPFMNLGITILFTKPETVVQKMFAFMDPLSPVVWMYVITAYLLVSLMLFAQARFAPGEWVNPHPCNPEPEELENSFSLANSMWLTIGSLMQQGSDILPRCVSVRMLAAMWWFFVLIVTSSYTANLAAFLTNVKMDNSINTVEDLAKQTKISYGAFKDGSTLSFFRNSNNSLYQQIYITMSDADPSVFTKDNDEGVDRVIRLRRKYAFFMESTTIEYQMARHCELQKIGPLLDNKGYGIATPPNSPYRTLISVAILHLQNKGELQQLKQKWWRSNVTCETEDSTEKEDTNKLGMSHVAGVFLVLLSGCVVSAFIACVEFIWNVRKVAIADKITPWEAFCKEIEFFVHIRATSKPVAGSAVASNTNGQTPTTAPDARQSWSNNNASNNPNVINSDNNIGKTRGFRNTRDNLRRMNGGARINGYDGSDSSGANSSILMHRLDRSVSDTNYH
ncbi:hypothetical protein QAD02_022930 [Eretmocerus hayati]|uniref:Uncharacterized protein n=1 Tax=Eretmocerus hayati TaxID=131215 RepID=A0ACC2PW24_9HYME|nr:hypothetical protein QAD02_022930 [Eretmocerus hayati]